MKRLLITILSVALTAVGYAQPKSTYYTSSTVDGNNPLDGKNGQTLELALKNIVYPHTKRTYAQLWTDFKTTDPGPSDSIPAGKTKTDLVYDMYAWMSQFPKFYSDNDHTQTSGFNREHVVPNSWWGGETGNGVAYTDLHHLTPADGAANNAKGNYALGEYQSGFTLVWPTTTKTNSSGTAYMTKDGHNHVEGETCLNNASHVWKNSNSTSYGGSENLYEPADEYKGDFARMYLYVVCAYEEELTWSVNYMFTSDSNKRTTIKSWAKELLLKWHRQDPVSDKERNRNNAVEKIQSNRNPFIDYPELVEYIWGNKTSEKFYLANAVSAYSDEYINGGGSTTTKTLQTIYLSGNATKTTYNVGDAFDYSGLTVIATYSDNTQADVTADATWAVNSELSNAGTYNVTVTATYNDKTATKTYSVTVEEEVTPDPDPDPEESDYKSIPYSDTFLDGDNDFTEEVKSGKLASVWSQNSSYGMKATGYSGGSPIATESWLVSPKFDATNMTSVSLAFLHTGRYFGTMKNEATLWVKVEGDDWQQVELTYMTGKDWNYVENTNDLSEIVAGKKFQFAFKYVSTTSSAGTWEIKNLSLTGTAALTGDIDLDGDVDSADLTALVQIIMGRWTSKHGNADLDGNGDINVADLTRLVEMLKK